MAQTEAWSRGRSVTRYEEAEHQDDTAERTESKPKSGLGARLSKFFGGGKSAAAQTKAKHHVFGKVWRLISAAFSMFLCSLNCCVLRWALI